MRVSAFSFVRDAIRLHYPIVQVIRSALPLVDEFIVAVGAGTDGTLEAIRSIGDPRIQILQSDWDPADFVHGRINAVQTDRAMEACTGEWGLYLQADEVLHQEDIPRIREAMRRWREDESIEGFLFRYLHFWGDFEHYHWTRNWYRHEVRVIRLGRGIRSWKSAQGFRRQGRKLAVRELDARIFHYGWVRPPEAMKRKQIALDRLHHPEAWVRQRHPGGDEVPFDYGALDHLRLFRETHPAVMAEWIASKSWEARDYRRPGTVHEHNKRGVRWLTALQDRALGRQIGVYRNYRRIGRA